jgi:predicted glycoside hydrolase/deacetylase ChbG (UPF0249 family)
MSRLILCADDFALSRPISETIAGLAAANRINAISCMAVCRGWERDSELLRDLPSSIQIGLHVTLTDEQPLTAAIGIAVDGKLPSLRALTRKARNWRLPLYAVSDELAAQFDRFEEAMGRPPAFVDGHQHVHSLPGIRQVFLEEVARRAPDAWVRDCMDRPSSIWSRPFRGKAIASALHSQGLKRDAAAFRLECNDSFAGHYDFGDRFAAFFPQFFRKPGRRHLVMCHPGAGSLAGDSIAEARPREAAALRKLPIADIAAYYGMEFRA